MAKVSIYLNFMGNTEEAFNYYKSVFKTDWAAPFIRMGDMPAPAAGPSADVTHHGEGKVESIGKDVITISHGPIASLQWGPMTMGFKLPATGLPQGIAVGNSVNFEIRQAKDGTFQITSIASTKVSNAAPTDTAAKGLITKPRDNASPGAKPRLPSSSAGRSPIASSCCWPP